MYKIGLTGSIASGKSTVSTMLAELGARIIDTDAIAHTVVGCDQPAWYEIVTHFGSEILLSDGTIDRKILGEKIFKDKVQRQCLEQITHPYIEQEVHKNMEQAERSGQPIVVLDVPLLFEIGWQKKVDSIWVVYVEEKVQIARLMARNQFTYSQAVERINTQMSLVEKAKQADIIIDNNSDIEHTRMQVKVAWEVLWKGQLSI